jgi:hypothetical protein
MTSRFFAVAVLALAACSSAACVPEVIVEGSGGGAGSSGSAGSGSGACDWSSAPCLTLAEPVPVGEGAHGLLIFDCNGDSQQDIVVANDQSATVSVARGHGDGTFSFQETYDAGQDPWLLARADFDGDGADDLVIGNFVNGANLLRGDGACGFSALQPIMGDDPLGEFSGGSLAVAAADLDGDGHPDVAAEVTGPYGEQPYIAVYWGVGDGTFLVPEYLEVDTSVADIVIADLSGDGILDIAGATSWLSGSTGDPAFVHVARGLGNRQFEAAVNYPVGGEPESIVVADFDADGRLDVATPGGYAWDSATVSLLRGKPDGTLAAQVTFSLGAEGPTGMAAGDLDADGRPDLVVGVGAENRVAILMGQSDPPFGGPLTAKTGDYPVGNDNWEPYYVALGHLNDDGKLDVAVTNFVGEVGILLSTP